MRAMLMAASRSVRTRLALVMAFAFLALSFGPLTNPAPVHAGTAGTMEANLLKWVNAERTKRGIPALRLRSGLVDLAGDRAAKLASTGDLVHASCLSCKLRNRGISFNRCSEVIAYTTYPWGDQAAQSIFNGWKGSSMHWGILMSRNYSAVGFGVAYRSSNRSTWAAGVLTG
jgi:uncharacterized protein YkwD